jgi:hypothetical protein
MPTCCWNLAMAHENALPTSTPELPPTGGVE